MQQARQEMEVECRLLRKEEVVMQQTLGVATAKLEALELESHALAQLGERTANLLGKNTARSLRAPRSPNPQRHKPSTTSSNTDYASISGETRLDGKDDSLTSSRVALNEHKSALIEKLKESEQLKSLLSLLDTKMNKTQDLLVSRQKHWFRHPRTKRKLAADPHEFAFRASSDAVQKTAEMVGLDTKTRAVTIINADGRDLKMAF